MTKYTAALGLFAVVLSIHNVLATQNGPMETPPKIPRHVVSGFSAGASIAINHLVAFSDVVEGLGIIGGSPYGCNTVPNAQNSCSGFNNVGHSENKSIPWNDWVYNIQSGYLAQRAANGSIASLINLQDKPVYLFSGLDDVWVYQSVMRGVETQFRNLSARVKTEFSLYAAHSWVVDSETCSHPGVQQPLRNCCGFKNLSTECPLPPNQKPADVINGCCGICSSGDGDDRDQSKLPLPFTDGWRPPINSCGYDMSGEILRWTLGNNNVKPRNSVTHATKEDSLYSFQQAQFLLKGWTTRSALVDDVGFVYIPNACKIDNYEYETRWNSLATLPRFSSNCGIHVHYHPCGGSWRPLSLSYMLQNALPAYAETNNFVIIYPQALAGVANPVTDGCWDWYGATHPAFDTVNGVQLNMVMNIMAALRQ